MKYFFYLYIILSCLHSNITSAFVINRVILSSDDNPLYLEFWPVVAPIWQKMGFRPTLGLIADKNVVVDEAIGDVIRFEPIPDVPNGIYAQCIRLLLPLYFPDEVSLIADIDMIPVDRNYFVDYAKPISDDVLLIYREVPPFWYRVQMCYNAGKGSVFKELFNIESIEQIPDLIKSWVQLNFGFYTDECVFYRYLCGSKALNKRVYFLNHPGVLRRLDRTQWKYNIADIRSHKIIDIHCKRPYSQHKQEIDMLIREARLLD